MDRKQKLMSLAVVSAALVLLAVTAVTANPRTAFNTPLYTYRMEQASSNNKFLSTSASNFAYSAEKGYALDYSNFLECSGGGDVQPLKPLTCMTCDEEICVGPTICNGTCSTCQGQSTCCYTCGNTCVSTCHTCVSTCSQTCVYTCSTCVSTCWNTCTATC